MSDIERRPPSRLTRRQREQRAYRLILATGGFGLLAVAGLVLAVAGVVGGGLWVVAAVVAVVCFVLFRRTVSGG